MLWAHNSECSYHSTIMELYCTIGLFHLLQFSSIHTSTQGFQRLYACWKRWVFNPHQNCPLEMEDQRKCFGRLFQMTRAAVLKLHLQSSVPVLGTAISPRSAEWRPARPERFAICMQTCWKYAGPAPWIQLNARSAVLKMICNDFFGC